MFLADAVRFGLFRAELRESMREGRAVTSRTARSWSARGTSARVSSDAEWHGVRLGPPTTFAHYARIVLGILGRPVVRLRLRGYSGPGIWDCPITRQPPSSPRARVTPMSYGPLRRSSTSARSSIVGGRDGHPRRTFRFADIKRGWRVEDSEETSLGTVVSSGEILLTVSRGLLSSKLYLPPSAVAEVHEGVVKLNVTSEGL